MQWRVAVAVDCVQVTAGIEQHLSNGSTARERGPVQADVLLLQQKGGMGVGVTRRPELPQSELPQLGVTLKLACGTRTLTHRRKGSWYGGTPKSPAEMLNPKSRSRGTPSLPAQDTEPPNPGMRPP